MKKEIKIIASILTLGAIIYPPIELFGINIGRYWLAKVDSNALAGVQWERLIIEIIAIWGIGWLVSILLDIQQKNQLLEQKKSRKKGKKQI